MKKPPIKVTPSQLAHLLADLRQIPQATPDACLSEDELADQATGRQPLNEAHLAACPRCAEILEELTAELAAGHLAEAAEVSPTLTDALAGLKNALAGAAASSHAAFQAAAAAWRAYAAPRPELHARPKVDFASPHPGDAAAAEEAEDGSLTFSFWSNDLGLRGARVRLRVGTEIFEAELKGGSATQVAAVIVLPREAVPAALAEIELLPIETGIV